LERRGALTSVLGDVVDLVGPVSIHALSITDLSTYKTQDAPDFNQIVGHGFNVTATYVASVDLNALANEGIEWVSKKITSNPVSNGAYGLIHQVVY
jgi:hypothetical protein